MKCRKIKGKLNDYITGILDFETKRLIEKHLADCPDCSNELSLLKRIESNIKAIGYVEPPSDLWIKIREKIENEEKAFFKEWYESITFFPSILWKRIAFVFGIVLILFSVGIFIMQDEFGKEETLYPSDYVAEHIIASYNDPLSDRLALNLIIASENDSK
ncbi:MAG: zf-HC2 domain-containing protein [Candidatus Schekmanbacteria bacterium]|nr:MAG: zf-HC2 domain-containing protein [Candidatus Schekmanbacteria bacterium]